MQKTLLQIHGHQDRVAGIEKLIKQRYKKDPDFKDAVDFLMKSPLNHKDIKRAADVAAMVKGMEWDWMLNA